MPLAGFNAAIIPLSLERSARVSARRGDPQNAPLHRDSAQPPRPNNAGWRVATNYNGVAKSMSIDDNRLTMPRSFPALRIHALHSQPLQDCPAYLANAVRFVRAPAAGDAPRFITPTQLQTRAT